MSADVNLADPTIEPTDEQLQELSREAFADVAARNRASLDRLRSQVAVLREKAIAFALAQAVGAGPASP
jgi:hypothetical protein